MNILWTIVAFLAALGPLIIFHELGHYSIARLCGVKVKRFSVGFGRPLVKRVFGPDRTEWVLAAIPFGLGFLGILTDERRRGWQDRLAGVDVLYESREPAAAPWSSLSASDPLAAEQAETTKAPGARGLRPQQVSGLH